MITTIRVSDYTILPGARHVEDGDGSADQFFDNYVKQSLIKILQEKDSQLVIDLDGTLGYASSFISQLAVRAKELCKNKRKLHKKLIIKSDDDIEQKERFWNEIG